MPKRDDLHTILLIGSGPIVIGQGCEFDYSGVQACKALKAEGYRVVLVNSNPATIMTDPSLVDRTYVEPITPGTVEKIIELEKERGTPIDAVLPTLGGQTGLNCACALFDQGVFQKHGIEMIGADRAVIHRAEDREEFAQVCRDAGLATGESKTVENLEDAEAYLEKIGLPAIIRPAFTLGGWGGGIAYNLEEFRELITRGLRASMIGQVQVDKSLLGWKEYELEVVRDKKDNCVIVCGIENIDAMGVHTGDSVTVAPILTLTDKEYQVLRDASLKIMRAVGVETGGSNVQFAVNPNPTPREDGTLPFEYVVIEMNPRVSRSSALASKATGFPIAKIAAKLAVGYTLDELRNDITGSTSACFEPSIDYVVTKMPRWTFEKFPEADETLTTQMKSVGEAMAIGRTLKESFQKVIRSMDVKRHGFGLDKLDAWLLHQRGGPSTEHQHADPALEWPVPEEKLVRKLSVPSQGRLYYIRYAMKMGWSVDRINQLTRIDPFFLHQMKELADFESELLAVKSLDAVSRELMQRAKQLGYSDAQLAMVWLGEISSSSILVVRARRKTLGVEAVFKQVDTCAAEFEAVTPYYYSTYQPGHKQLTAAGTFEDVIAEDELTPRLAKTDAEKVVILGGGPNRIGQGIEFDYCCVHASFAARELGYESVMINSNPETVSTDYDTSDLLFFEPLTLEDVLNVVERLNGGNLVAQPGSPGLVKGLIVQFGGQTPLNLAHGLVEAGAPILGTSISAIDRAEDREAFDELLTKLDLKRPNSGIARSIPQAVEVATKVGYPVLVRPSYVLGGRGMEICPDEPALRQYISGALASSDLDDAPVLIDQFLDAAMELDVDVAADGGGDGDTQLVCAVMEHIEQAGVHSGDSTCMIPPAHLRPQLVEQVRTIARSLAKELGVCGLMNVQMAIKDDEVYIIEVNPRASRTVPYVGKAKGVAWAQVAAKAMMGVSLTEQGAREIPDAGYFAVKAPVFPFQKFPGVDFVLGPEMRSTGEVMGIDVSLEVAYLKAMLGAGVELPGEGGVFVSVREQDKKTIVPVVRSLLAMGFTVHTTEGTGAELVRHGMKPRILKKIREGARPNVVDLMSNEQIQLVINTPTRTGWQTDEGKIRSTAVRLGIPMVTTATAAEAAVRAIEAKRAGVWGVRALQDYSVECETPEIEVQRDASDFGSRV
ncbi:MAG: carbamoyl-phosphate synthase large subunit [Phycisphaerales bacterium]|jgi:carbamoyl-phosphate synthase large subunit